MMEQELDILSDTSLYTIESSKDMSAQRSSKTTAPPLSNWSKMYRETMIEEYLVHQVRNDVNHRHPLLHLNLALVRVV